MAILYIVSTLLIVIVNVFFMHPKYKIVRYDDCVFSTGDIILFHALDNVNSLFIGCYYTHVGVVCVIDGIEYLFEAANNSNIPYYPKGTEPGIYLSKLRNRLSTYKGYTMHKRLRTPVSQEATDRLISFTKYATQRMYYDKNVLICGASKLFFNYPLATGTNCGEIAYISLIVLGLLPIEYASLNNKHHLRWLADCTTLVNNEYNEPTYVFCDYFM
jgi:hypothetical protein